MKNVFKKPALFFGVICIVGSLLTGCEESKEQRQNRVMHDYSCKQLVAAYSFGETRAGFEKQREKVEKEFAKKGAKICWTGALHPD